MSLAGIWRRRREDQYRNDPTVQWATQPLIPRERNWLEDPFTKLDKYGLAFRKPGKVIL